MWLSFRVGVFCLFLFFKKTLSCIQIMWRVNHLRTVLLDAVGMPARLSSLQMMRGRGRVCLFALSLLKDKCTNADTFSVCFLSLKNRGPLPIWLTRTRLVEVRQKFSLGLVLGRCLELLWAQSEQHVPCVWSLEKGENMQFIYIFT